MRFIDEARIFVQAGNGGRGCVSFRREKFVPRGGPDGGDGGHGGDIVLIATSRQATLQDFCYRTHYRARTGKAGKGSNKRGRNGETCCLYVPVGTVVACDDSGELLADLVDDNQKVTVVKGGRGGRGNASYATPVRQAPDFAQEGKEGEKRWLRLELKLLADVGIVGLPNAGKSTLVGKLSAANPKVASYPFTTLRPHLGVVEENETRFVVADLPGLVRGAHRGVGLGLQFLRHAERAALFLHLVSAEPNANPVEDFVTLREEIACYNPAMAQRPLVVGLNKVDLRESEAVDQLIAKLSQVAASVFPISALTGSGLEELRSALAQAVVEYRRRRDTLGTPPQVD